MGGWVDCSGVIIKLNIVKLQLQFPAGTELVNKSHSLKLYIWISLCKSFLWVCSSVLQYFCSCLSPVITEVFEGGLLKRFPTVIYGNYFGPSGVRALPL